MGHTLLKCVNYLNVVTKNINLTKIDENLNKCVNYLNVIKKYQLNQN